MCLISFWYQALKREHSKDKAIQPAADLGCRSILVCTGYMCILHVELSAVRKWWVLLLLFCHWGKLNAEKWLGSGYLPALVASKSSRACLSWLYAPFTRLYGSLKPAIIVLNAHSVLTPEEMNFTVEQCDPCVYKLVKCIAMMRCKNL